MSLLIFIFVISFFRDLMLILQSSHVSEAHRCHHRRGELGRVADRFVSEHRRPAAAIVIDAGVGYEDCQGVTESRVPRDADDNTGVKAGLDRIVRVVRES